jgi:uroporphyrinogen-III synthase
VSTERRPRVLVTRAPHQASALADALCALDAEPVVVPAIEIAELESYAALDTSLAQLCAFDWVVFTSANAVAVFQQRLKLVEAAITAKPSRPRVAAIGAATVQALETHGWRADLVAPQAVAESLAEALAPLARRGDGSPARFLLVRAEQARDVLPAALCAAGAEVAIAPAYRTVMPEGSLEKMRAVFAAADCGVDAVTFTSSSSVRNFFALLDAAGVVLPQSVLRASIGPITSAALREFGYEADVEAGDALVGSLAGAVMRALREKELDSRNAATMQGL